MSSLDTSKVKNVKILQNSLNKHVKWSDVEALWGNGVLPHNIVHINAGWSIGPNMVDVWDGLNQNGRRVAPGSYLMVLSTFDEDNRQFVDKRKIGISMN